MPAITALTTRRIFRLMIFPAMALMFDECTNDSSLRTKVLRELEGVDGVFAVAFEDLSTGEQLLINASDRYHAASTMKVPVMIEVFKQAQEGKFAMDDSLEVRNAFASIVDGSPFSLDVADDSDTLIYHQIGQKRSVYSLVYDMIILSSNLATNLIIEMVDARNVTATMRTLGANDIQVLRGVEDNKAYGKGLNNTTTAYDLLVIMKAIAEGNAVNAEASEAMMDILFSQRHRDIIPARLPADVRVASKRGWITGVQHDCGIVVLPDGRRYVLVLLSRELKDDDRGADALANVSRVVFDHLMNKK